MLRAEERFTRLVATRHLLTTELVTQYENGLFSLRNLLTPETAVSVEEFTQAARRVNGGRATTNAYGWVPVVSAENRLAAESNLAANYPGHAHGITELSPDAQLVRAAARPEYYPICYIEPVPGNELALGFDLKSSPVHDTLELSRQTRQVSISRPVQLVQDPRGDPAVLMTWPVWHTAAKTSTNPAGATDVFAGFVQAVFRLRSLLGDTADEQNEPSADVLFIDAAESDPAQRVLYYHPADGRAPGPLPREDDIARGLFRALPLPLAGRNWEIIYRARPAWIEAQYTSTPWWRALGIMGVTGCVAVLIYIIGRRTAVVAREVRERTAELSESRRQLDNLLGSLPGMAYRCQYETQLRVVYVSEGALALTGYSPHDLTAGVMHFRDIVHPEDLSRVRDATRAGLRENRAIEVEYRITARDGTTKWLLSRGRGVYGANGLLQWFEGLAIDITAQKTAESDRLALERKLLAGQKLESLGLLAGGIAHDFNNLLTGILGNANLARVTLPASAGVDSQLRGIEAAALRAAELCRQMLAYAGQGRFIIEPADLSALVGGMLPLLELSIGREIHLRLALAPGLPSVMADATQLRQIVMNLIINASDAIGNRPGEISITSGCARVDRGTLHTAVGGEDLSAGDYVYLEVRDTGCGMTAETVQKIFDPFFSTKFAGRGLGLAAALGIVRGHRGALVVESTVGEGSKFRLLLPPIAAPAAPTATTRRPASWTSQGTILVVEDDDAVRAVTSAMLRSFGFTPHPEADGESALKVFNANPSRFDLVLLDLLMPHLSGEQTLARLRATRADVRVLIMSGYSESDTVTRLADGRSRVGFLPKPFTRDALEEKLRSMLN